MNRIAKTLISALLLQAITAVAEPVTVPHTFTPNTPAKANEVNDNLQALATAIGNLKRVSLYQNNTKIGTSVLANLIKLDSGYLLWADKKKSSPNIYLAKAMDTLYYTTNNCSGTVYTDRMLEDDLAVNEIGAIGSFRDTAYYASSVATPVSNLYVNSVKGEDAVCRDISQFQETSNSLCAQQLMVSPPPATVRGNLVTYDTSSNPYCYGNDQDGSVEICQIIGLNYFVLNCPNAVVTAGTTLLGDYFEQVKLSKLIDYSGRIEKAYVLLPNNPAVTGITTSACVNAKGEPAVCVPNGQLQNE